MEVIKQKVELLSEFGNKIPQIKELSKKIGIESGYIILGVLALSGLLVLIFMGGTILTVVLTVLYPAYKSIKALETKDDEDDDKEWLTYWCVFGVFTLIDEFGYIILNLIPFYFYIKLIFFVWLMNPKTKGSLLIYNKVLSPLLK